MGFVALIERFREVRQRGDVAPPYVIGVDVVTAGVDPMRDTFEGDVLAGNASIAEAKSALEGSDMDAIKAATEKMQQAGYKLAEVVYSTQGPDAASQAAAAESTPADDTIEADYEVVDDENEGK